MYLGPEPAELWCEQREEVKQFLCQMMSFLDEPHLLVFWSGSWKEAAAMPFLLKFIAQTAPNGLGAPAPAGVCYLHVVSVQEEFLHCRPLWESSKSSKRQTVSLPS